MFDFISRLIRKDKEAKIRRIAIALQECVNDTFVPVAPMIKEERIDIRNRANTYYEVLAETIEDFANRLLSDDDLEEAVYLLIQYAKSRGYNFKGSSAQVLLALQRSADRRDSKEINTCSPDSKVVYTTNTSQED